MIRLFHATLFSCLIHFFTNIADTAEVIKQRLLVVYIREALATKGGCSEGYKLITFSTLLASLTPEDFSSVVQPVLEKLQKKNPDSVLMAVESLVEHVRIDLSAHLGIFLPPVLRQLRSAKEDIRSLALKLLGNLAIRCGDSEVCRLSILPHNIILVRYLALSQDSFIRQIIKACFSLAVVQAVTSMVCHLSDILAGKAGVIAQWHQRHSIFLALENVRRSVASAGSTPAAHVALLAARAIDGLLPAVEKELHDATRAVGLGCITRWAVELETLPPKLLHSFERGLDSAARPTSTIFAAGASQLSGCTRFCHQLAPLVPGLLRRVTLGAKKPNVLHPDAIYSAKAVLSIAAVDAACADRVDKEFPWHALIDRVSFLYPACVMAPRSAEVPVVAEPAGPFAPHIASAICQTIALGARRITGPSDIRSAADLHALSGASSLALVQCMVLPDENVRQIALEAGVGVCKFVGGAQATLLRACREVRTQVARAGQAITVPNTLPLVDIGSSVPLTLF